MRGGYRRATTALGLFAAAWLAWSGHYTPLLLALGVASCLLVLWLAARTGFFDEYVYSLYLGPGLPRYWAWLLIEIARSNVAVAAIVLSPRMRVDPTVVTIDTAGLSAIDQTMIANSITLTPGTVSINVGNEGIEVHCLNGKIADAVRRGDVLRRARALAGGA